MLELAKDPIIETYINLTKNSQECDEVPLFSETLLRIAFRQVLGKYRCIISKELLLYRKLLLFHYADEYSDVQDLLQIMNCFNEETLAAAIEECEDVMNTWQEFILSELMPDALSQTFKMLITEFCKRYKALNDQVPVDLLRSKAFEFRGILNYDEVLMCKSIKKMQSRLLNPPLDAQAASTKWTQKDLTTAKIINDLSHKISPLLREKLRELNNSDLMESSVEQLTEEVEDIPNKRLRLEEEAQVNGNEVDHDEPNKSIQVMEETEPTYVVNDEEEEFTKLGLLTDWNAHIAKSEDVAEQNVADSENEQFDIVDIESTIDEAEKIQVVDEEEDDIEIVSEVIDMDTALQYISDVYAFSDANGYDDVRVLMETAATLLMTYSGNTNNNVMA